MRRALTLTVLVLSFAVHSFAQQVVVREPNGPEYWKRGDTHTSVTMSTIPPSAADCSCTSTGVVVVKTKGAGLGTKVEYEFFGGRQLNEGWSFVSLSYSDAACRDHAGHAVLIMPQPGSRNILFKVRLWTEGIIGGGIAATLSVCEFRINSIVIRGPGDKPVSEAFK